MKSNDTILEFAEKQKKNFDQMATMHFSRADRYKVYYFIEDSFEIIISVFLCGLTFFNWDFFTNTPFSWLNRYFPGLAGIFLFAFTCFKRICKHAEISQQHYIAGKILTQAKLDLGNKIEQWKLQKNINNIEEEILLYIQNHCQNINNLPQIPENEFAKLKHEHQHKIAFSKFLDTHKESCWYCCKIKFFFKSIQFKEDTDSCTNKKNSC